MDWGVIRQRHSNVQRIAAPEVEMFQVRGFLDRALCQTLIEAIDAARRPSTIADDMGDPGFRTSETCDLYPANAVVAGLDMRLSELLGIAIDHGEIMQGQRYAVGQEFKAHTDYFDPHGSDYATYCAVSGQRTWTAMIYLNEPGAGGATRFKEIDKIFQPETGKLLCWNNRRDDGQGNPATLHHGMKVRAGTKYIVTKWFRERPTGYLAG